MSNWANQFQDLKNQFVTRSKERLVAIEALLTRLQSYPTDTAILRQIMQHFHWLAGSGGTYGFDDITQWGTYGEELCDYLLKLNAPVNPVDYDKLATALRTVDQLFAAQAQAAPQANETVETPFSPQSNLNTQERQMPNRLANTIQQAANNPDLANLGSSLNSNSGTYNPSGQQNRDLGNATGNPTQGNPNYGPATTPFSSGPAGLNTPAASGNFPAVNMPSSTNPLPSNTNTTNQNQYGPNAYTQPPSSGRDTGYTAPPISGMQNSGNQPQPRTQPNTSEIRSSSPFPGQAAPIQAQPEPTRVLETENKMPMSSPPMTSVTDSGTTFIPGPIPGFPSSREMRGASRLGHIPTDRKFAILIDANIGNLGPIKAALEEQQIIVEQFGTATDVKPLFAERLPDVLILTAPLPDNNGYDLVEYLRSLDSGHRPIVLLLGQQAAFLDKVRAIRAGADAFFEYPSELTEAIQKLHMLLERDKIESYKILSVEDDPDMAAFIKLTLSSAGYTVLHIADPKTFEDQFLSFEPDLVMLDVLLGDLTGFELAKYIRQNDRFATLPIVFLTTQNKLHQHIRSAIAGGDEHLIKPVAPQLLIATIASRLERARALKRLIDRDGLTRCLNYGSFMERAQKLAGPDGFRTAPAMMMIDVDNMKKINEQLGFAAGDRIISSIANMLLKGFRNTDLIARFGNDQFAIVLEHLDTKQLHDLSAEVLKAISGTPQMVKGRPVYVTCSGGVAVLEQGMSVQTWLSAAQDSLRKAKDAGGNRAVLNPRS
ncbi:MAG: response regulator [Candidatus Obscuribacterales bacterium]|nr:response regulator [Candidatus Obscuribacterales bacterium]